MLGLQSGKTKTLSRVPVPDYLSYRRYSVGNNEGVNSRKKSRSYMYKDLERSQRTVFSVTVPARIHSPIVFWSESGRLVPCK